jgi:YVTN family beta-propeller protein
MAQGPYRILDRWKIGGEGGWDDLTADPAAQRLYVTHATRVDVIDTVSGKLAGAITGLHGSAHGIALSPDGRLGYISDGAGNAVVVFDRTNYSTVATIAVGNNPDAILYEPVTKTIWVFNGRSRDASVIDEASRKVIATVPMPGKPEFAATDGKGAIYDNIEDKNEIVRIDAASLAISAEWKLTGCESPSGLAFDRQGARLFAACDGRKMAVLDASTGRQIANPAISDGPDGAGFDPAHNLAFASCGDGNLAVVDAGVNAYSTIQLLPTQRGARTMTLDPATGRIYTVTADFGPKPAATPENPRPRPAILPGSFTVLVIGR